MVNIKVTSDELYSVSQKLRSGSESIEDQLNMLNSLVQSLLNNSWNGMASSQFNDLYRQWDTAGKNLKQALVGISSQLDTAAINYQQTEEAIMRAFQ